ncbi:MAG: sulfite exporter TauE/SafE family protein [Planctomycetes bacterium]|nr:sulfite exporter TauE/SafE family protein [Planctomycetota bacterium]
MSGGISEVLIASIAFGAMNSLHCAGMCGPLALVFATRGGKRGRNVALYHTGRLGAYAIVGFVCGAAGEIFLPEGLGKSVAWVLITLAIFLALGAAGIERFLKFPIGDLALGRVVRAGLAKAERFSPAVRSFAVGALTPLLPCGLSMTVYGTAVVSGDSILGAVTLIGFALGSLPVLALAQTQIDRLRTRLGPRGFLHVSRVMMLVAAVVLFWRGLQTLQDASCCPT